MFCSMSDRSFYRLVFYFCLGLFCSVFVSSASHSLHGCSFDKLNTLTDFSLNDTFWEFFKVFPDLDDGTVTREPNDQFQDIFPIEDPNNPTPVLTKDITINEANNTWARIFLPRKAIERSYKFPLVVYLHGGGFILFSAATNIFHDFCQNMALQLPAVVVSVTYRLAPEHRLPAAYDDVVEALHWIKMSDEVWLRDYVDYSSCFIMGNSAGGNLAYHASLRVAERVSTFDPLKIRGFILHQPFFGGIQRTESEVRLDGENVLPPTVTDVLWYLTLPIGVDRDHEYCNPTIRGGSKVLDQIKSIGWRILVTGYSGDQLFDRQIDLFKLMKKRGIKVEGYFCEGGQHGVDLVEPSKVNALIEATKTWIKITLSNRSVE